PDSVADAPTAHAPNRTLLVAPPGETLRRCAPQGRRSGVLLRVEEGGCSSGQRFECGVHQSRHPEQSEGAGLLATSTSLLSGWKPVEASPLNSAASPRRCLRAV